MHRAGWSLILPAGWVPPAWLALAFAGVKPAGQREWRWAHTAQRRPFFPHDFPDTQVSDVYLLADYPVTRGMDVLLLPLELEFGVEDRLAVKGLEGGRVQPPLQQSR